MSIISILNHPCSLMVYYYLFSVFYLCKVLYSGFLRFKGNFVDGQNITHYSTLNKITQFLFVESSTVNPKLYSVGVPIKFPWKRTVRTIISGKFQRQIKSCCLEISSCSTMHNEQAKKTGEIIFSVTQNLTCELPQFLRDFDFCRLSSALCIVESKYLYLQ